MKAPGAGAARIKEEDTVFIFARGFVAVSIDHGRKSCGLRLEVEILEFVEHVDRETSGFEDIGFRNGLRPGAMINVSADGGDRGDQVELVQDFEIAYVASVEDEVGALQGFDDFRAKQAVRVRDDADGDGFSHGPFVRRLGVDDLPIAFYDAADGMSFFSGTFQDALRFFEFL